MSYAKKKYYTVIKGRKPGVYSYWSGEGGAEEQVKGFPGAVFKGFATRAEAEYHFSSGGKKLPPASAASASPAALPSAGLMPEATPRPLHQEEVEAGKVVIFTDGASLGNPGPGGYGVVMLDGKIRKEFSGGFRCTTNNRMELLACIVALRQLQKPARVILYSDSRYVVDAVVKSWARRWRSQGWMRSSAKRGIRERAENSDLWEEMLAILDRQPVEFCWIRGHSSHPENERCDRLAVEAAQKRNLPVDPGFQGNCA